MVILVEIKFMKINSQVFITQLMYVSKVDKARKTWQTLGQQVVLKVLE